MTEMIEWIEASQLPPRTLILLEEFGPYLTAGLTLGEIGRKTGRSEDWVSSRIATLREDLARHVLAQGGDDLRPAFRERLERYLG